MSHQLNTNNSSIVVHVRSADGVQHTDGYNTYFSVYLSQPLKCKEDEYFLISLSSAQIPYSFYNIQSNMNNQLIVNEEVINLTPANYNINTFIAELTDKVKSLSVKYNKPLAKFEFTASETLEILLTSLSPTSQLGMPVGTFKVIPNLTTMSRHVVNMYSFNSLFIKTPNLFSLNSVESRHGGFSDILSKIEIQSSPNEFIYYLASMNGHKSLIKQRTIAMMSFQLCATSNHLINLNGCPWEFSVQFDIIKQQQETAEQIIENLPRLISSLSVKDGNQSRRKTAQKISGGSKEKQRIKSGRQKDSTELK